MLNALGRIFGSIFGVAFLVFAWNMIMWFTNPDRDAIRAARTEAKIEFATWGLRLLLAAGYVLVILPLLILIFLGLWQIWKRLDERNRQRDGSYALREYHLLAWWARALYALQNKGLKPPKIIVDPDYVIGAAAIVGGAFGFREIEPAAGWDLAKLESTERNRVAAMQAIAPGDRALIEGDGGTVRPGVQNVATAKMLTGHYDKPPEMPVAPARTTPVYATATPAIAAAQPTALPLGIAQHGDVVAWHMPVSVHLRVTGQTQRAGKTNLIQTLAAGALRHGHQVIVLDRRRFKDWQQFEGKVELIDSRDPRNVVAVLERLGDIYTDRDRNLAGGHDGNFTRIILVISEFGSTMKVAKSDGVYRQIELPLELIMREAGGTGVHVVAEDQIAEKWALGIIGNAAPVAGYLPPGYGQSGGDYGAHKLEPYQFAFDGQVLDTWHIAPELPGLLATVPALNGNRIVDPATVRPVFAAAERSVDAERLPNGNYQSEPNAERTERQPGITPIPSPPFAVRSAPKRDVIEWWIANIGGTQAEFRQWAEAQGGDFSRGYVSDVFNDKI